MPDLLDEHLKLVDEHTAKLGYRPGVFTAGAQLVLVKAATDQDFRRFNKKSTAALMAAAAPKKRSDTPQLYDAQMELALCCVVYPTDRAALKSLLESKPALVPRLADKATELAGEDVEEHEGN